MATHFSATRPFAAAITFALPLLAAGSKGQGAEEVLQKTRETYTQMESYADTGIVRIEYGTSGVDTHKFSTVFSRNPRHLLLDFHKQTGDQYVIWADPGAFLTWWKTTGQRTDYPNPNNTPAISMSGQQTSGVALKIPTLLYGKAFESYMLKMANPVLEGAEEVGGHRCHRISGRASDLYGITGHETNVRQVTVWIDAETFLIRKSLEEGKALPGQRDRTITIFEPHANPMLDDAQFKFTPPTP